MFGLDVVIDIDIHSHFLFKKTILKSKKSQCSGAIQAGVSDIDIHYHFLSKK